MRFANRLGLSRCAWVFICSLQAVSSTGVTPVFYRSSAGAEIDLLLTWPNGEHWAIEVKRSTTPKVERGFYSACDDIKPVKKWVIYPGAEAYPRWVTTYRPCLCMLLCGRWRIGAGIEMANFCAVPVGGIMNLVNKSRERSGFNWVLTLPQ